jgi:hypothetical protein
MILQGWLVALSGSAGRGGVDRQRQLDGSAERERGGVARWWRRVGKCAPPAVPSPYRLPLPHLAPSPTLSPRLPSCLSPPSRRAKRREKQRMRRKHSSGGCASGWCREQHRAPSQATLLGVHHGESHGHLHHPILAAVPLGRVSVTSSPTLPVAAYSHEVLDKIPQWLQVPILLSKYCITAIDHVHNYIWLIDSINLSFQDPQRKEMCPNCKSRETIASYSKLLALLLVIITLLDD